MVAVKLLGMGCMILRSAMQVVLEEIRKASRFLVHSYELLKELDQRTFATLLLLLRGPK
jgi:hypothetical protein